MPVAKPRAAVTLGSLELVAELGQYKPFGEAALGVTVFDGVEAVTIQDFGYRIARQRGSLSSGGGTSPGLVSGATLAALEAMLRAWGTTQALADTLGNAGTVKPIAFTRGFEYRVPGAQEVLYGYTLTWQWLTLATLYGAPYTGR
jgi:hypothetical protein